ncbi:uncharacterized protein LOC142776609 isoform X2 [Rhipicephalus microplus]|uniref:uncharacterized protein LOC142776609 isoform X2 n=1 Tax=Rhipicephalus microplus TaxID=6941 RepID=UPI003F6A96C9
MQPAHIQAKSWSTLSMFCAGHSISIRQDTGMNNNGSSRNYASSVSETVQETPISDMTVLADFSRSGVRAPNAAAPEIYSTATTVTCRRIKRDAVRPPRSLHCPLLVHCSCGFSRFSVTCLVQAAKTISHR